MNRPRMRCSVQRLYEIVFVASKSRIARYKLILLVVAVLGMSPIVARAAGVASRTPGIGADTITRVDSIARIDSEVGGGKAMEANAKRLEQSAHAPICTSATATACHGSFTIYLDEDFFQTTPSTDRNYTMGLGLARATALVHDQGHDRPLLWFEGLMRRYALGPLTQISDDTLAFWMGSSRPRLAQFSEMLSGTAFTSQKLYQEVPEAGDRPYAFLLGWTVSRTLQSGDQAVTSELTLGTIGSRLGRNVQRFIHHVGRGGRADCDTLRLPETGPCDPKGWGTQVMDVPSLWIGIPTLRYALSNEYGRSLEAWPDGSSTVDFAGVLGGELGYYTSAWTGARMRFGYFQTRFYEWKQNPLDMGARAPEAGPPPKRAEIFVFAGARPRFMLYNALLQGYPGYSGTAFSASEVRHAVMDGEVGISAAIRFGEGRRRVFRLTWVANAFRSPEFVSPLARWHQWGGVYATMPSEWLPAVPNVLGL